MSPKLSTNLLSIGQLVDNNCTVQFSNSGCIVQDQVSEKMIVKGPKVGRLFPLLLSSSPMSNYVAYNAIQSDNQVWHRRLGTLTLMYFESCLNLIHLEIKFDFF